MPFDLAALLAAHQGESFELHSQFMNPPLVKALTTLGFDRQYLRAEGSYMRADRVTGIDRGAAKVMGTVRCDW